MTTELPWSEDDLKFWRAEIDRSRQLRDDTIQAWDAAGNIGRYTPKSVMDGQAVDARVNVAKDFADVEYKKAALFYDTPTVSLVPDPGTNPQALLLHQELINSLLSSKRMDAKATVLPTIQDCLVAVQPVMTEIGYASVQVPMPQQVPVMGPDGQPVIDPMTGQPQMQTQQVPVIVWEKFFWEKISAKASLVPTSWRSTRYDDAPWLGFDFLRPASQVRKEFGRDPEWVGTELKEKPYFEPLTPSMAQSEAMAGGTKIWYRAYWRDPNVTHPDVIRELVLLEGEDTPVVHRNCPYQEIGPDGRLTANSIPGYPDHPLAIRDLTDAAYVAADCTITGPLTRELNKSRTMNIEQRDGSKLHLLYDADKLNQEVLAKLTEGNLPRLIPVAPGALDQGVSTIMAQVPALQQSRESFTTQQIIEHDRAEILAIGSNQLGGMNRAGRTATEVSTVQRNTDVRFEQERQRVLEWWLKGVQKLSALVLRYGDRLAMEILGPQRGQMWVQARNAGQFGLFNFETVIDSGNYVDIEAKKRQDLQLYNLTRKDPATNPQVVLGKLAVDYGLDPSLWLAVKPTEQKPEPPSLSINVRPEDLDPALPSYVGTHAMLTATGVKGLPPPQVVAPPPPGPMMANHGGPAEQAPRLNQHQLNESGEQPGPAVQ